LAKVWRIELQIAVLETAVLPLHYTDKEAGLEPATNKFYR